MYIQKYLNNSRLFIKKQTNKCVKNQFGHKFIKILVAVSQKDASTRPIHKKKNYTTNRQTKKRKFIHYALVCDITTSPMIKIK